MMLSNGKVAKMPDKKLTDNEIVNETNEIIHELSSLNRQYTGADAVRFSIGFFRKILKNLRFLLDLINRLQEKNSNLTSDLTSLQKDLTSLQAENKRLTTLAELGNTRANDYRVMRDRALKAEAENERLEKENQLMLDNHPANTHRNCVVIDNGVIYTKTIEDYERFLTDVSTEAYKEFAEKLLDTYEIWTDNDELEYRYVAELVDNLLKELVGEDNA